jgi:hypothetical protein
MRISQRPIRRVRGTSAGWDSDGRAPESSGNSLGFPHEEAAHVLKKIPFFPKRLIFTVESCQLFLLRTYGLARSVLRLHLALLGPPAVQHIVRNPGFTSHLGHLSARFPREPNRLGLECIGELTSRGVWHADIPFYGYPTYRSVYEIREG